MKLASATATGNDLLRKRSSAKRLADAVAIALAPASSAVAVTSRVVIRATAKREAIRAFTAQPQWATGSRSRRPRGVRAGGLPSTPRDVRRPGLQRAASFFLWEFATRTKQTREARGGRPFRGSRPTYSCAISSPAPPSSARRAPARMRRAPNRWRERENGVTCQLRRTRGCPRVG